MPRAYLDTPIGVLELVATQRLVRHVRLVAQAAEEHSNPLLDRAKQELREYFAGKRRAFSLPCCYPPASPFRIKVWDALAALPYGTTLSYGELAEKIGCPGAARAVGKALGENPLLILRPCHRVVAKHSLGGFHAGVQVKAFLLALEADALGQLC